MTIFREPLTNDKGEVMLSMQATGVVPAQATQFRGLWVTMNGLICATNDTGQARKYVGGFALEDPSGLLLVTETTPASVPMDGINANAAGAVVKKTGAGSLIHQGIGMTASAPGGPIVVNQDEPALTFHAGLEYQSNSGSIQGAQVRDSEATYWAQDGRLAIATINEIQQEFQNGQPLGTLMEPASTNKNTNYNANPDAALTGVTKLTGSGTLSRELQTQKLEESGLSRVCSSGYVFKIDARGESLTTVAITGATGNTNVHSYYARVYCPQGSGKVQLAGSSEVSFSQNDKFEMVGRASAAASAGAQLEIQAAAGALVYFILNKLEEQPVATSDITTVGAAGVRALDQLSWSLTDSQGRNILNQAQGMAATIFQPKYNSSDLPSTTVQALVSLVDNAVSILYHNRSTGNDAFVTTTRTTGGDSATASIAGGFTKDTVMVITSRWNTVSNLQVAFKRAGSWTTGGGTFTTQWENNGNIRLSRLVQLPMYMRNLYFWSEDKGQAWLESFFSGVAN